MFYQTCIFLYNDFAKATKCTESFQRDYFNNGRGGGLECEGIGFVPLSFN